MTTPPVTTPWVPMWPMAASVPAPVEGKWLKTQGGAMVWADLPASAPATQSRQYPLKLTAPRSQSFQGNAFWTVASMPGFDFAHWEFVKDVEGRVSGQILIPKTVAASSNAKIILVIASPASGGVTRMNVAYSMQSIDNGYVAAAPFTFVGAQDITSHVTAYGTRYATFALPNLAASAVLLLEIIHEGAHANDTITQNTWLVEAYLECDS